LASHGAVATIAALHHSGLARHCTFPGRKENFLH
jgi:hypothetical protein